MNLQISPQTKREMIIFLIVAMGFIWLALSLENNYQNQRLEELKIEKQKLEKQNEELFQEYKNEIKTKTKKDSVSAELNRPECGEEVADTVSGEIKEISLVEKEIREVAEQYNFKWIDYLVKLAKCESSLNPNAIGDSGNSRGLFQIHKGYHPEVSDEQAFDIEFATIWTMNKINNGQQGLWSCDKIILALDNHK